MSNGESNGNQDKASTREERSPSVRIGRRRLLTSLGAMGVTLVSGSLLFSGLSRTTAIGNSVSKNVYGNKPPGKPFLLAEGTANVLDYGAAGDGITDDTLCFQKALSSGAKYVIVPSGKDYVISDTLDIPENVTLDGFGSGYVFSHSTRLLFKGAGTKRFTIDGAGPFSVSNPDAGAPYLADSGARGDVYSTLDLTQSFSAAVVLNKGSCLANIGLYPYFDGVAGYEGTDGRLSDDWDVGVWCRNSDGWRVIHCTVAGHWRKTAQLVSSSLIGDGRIPSNELGVCSDTFLQGFRGLAVRSPNVDSGSNYGFAGTDWINCTFRPLLHQSAHLATSSYIAAPFDSPSGAIELSGASLRGIQFLHCTVIGRDDISVIADKAREILFNGCYFESKEIKVNGTWTTGTLGSRMIATSNSILEFHMVTKYGIDFSPNYKREDSISRYSSTGGLYHPARTRETEYERLNFSKSYTFRLMPGGIYKFVDKDLVSLFEISENGNTKQKGNTHTTFSNAYNIARTDPDGTIKYVMRAYGSGNVDMPGGHLSTGGMVKPLADNVHSLGAAASRWSAVYAGTGVIQTSDARAKTDITDEPLGLDFIRRLRPRQFKYAEAGRQDDKGQKPHHGLIAQEVKQVLDELGVDHAGFVAESALDDKGHDAGELYYGIRYNEFISHLIKAVQELSAKVERLERGRG